MPVAFWVEFWPAFWADAIATLVGVGAGVPIALAIDRRFQSQRRSAQRAAEERRLNRAFDALSAALRSNRDVLTHLSGAVATREVPLHVNFNSAVWEAVQSDVGLAEDPTLQVNLATFFEDLDELARLQIHLIDVLAGVGSALAGSELTRGKLFTLVASASTEMTSRSKKLLEDISAAKSAAAPAE